MPPLCHVPPWCHDRRRGRRAGLLVSMVVVGALTGVASAHSSGSGTWDRPGWRGGGGSCSCEWPGSCSSKKTVGSFPRYSSGLSAPHQPALPQGPPVDSAEQGGVLPAGLWSLVFWGGACAAQMAGPGIQLVVASAAQCHCPWEPGLTCGTVAAWCWVPSARSSFTAWSRASRVISRIYSEPVWGPAA